MTEASTAHDHATTPADYRVEMVDITKRFGALEVLKGVNLRIRPGRGHRTGRRQRRGQVHLDEDARRSRAPGRAAASSSTERRCPVPAPRGPRARHRDGLPGPRPVQRPGRRSEPVPRPGGVPPTTRRLDHKPNARAGGRAPAGAAHPGHEDPPGRRDAVRWPAAGGRHRPSRHLRPQGAGPGRADSRAGGQGGRDSPPACPGHLGSAASASS